MPIVDGITSPNTGNLLVGKGFILFKPNGSSNFYCVGNCPSMTVTPKTTLLDHFDSQAGTKTKDLTIVTEKSMEVKVQMEEMTANNLALLLLGDVDMTNPAQPIVNFFTTASKTGHFKFYAANDVGPRWYVDIPSITFNPSGDWSPISDGFASMQATGTVNAQGGVWGTATLQLPVGTAAPENLLLPFIGGLEVHGDILTAHVGAWVGADFFTYQWYKSASPISYATDQTYTTVVGDVGSPIHVVVTAHNGVGTTSGTSAATGNIT